jgi:hypothetical protein
MKFEDRLALAAMLSEKAVNALSAANYMANSSEKRAINELGIALGSSAKAIINWAHNPAANGVTDGGSGSTGKVGGDNEQNQG